VTDAPDRFRPWALAALREHFCRVSDPQIRVGLKFMIDALASPEVVSLLLPVNGRCIDHATPAMLVGGDFLAMPDGVGEVLLEYSTSAEGFQPNLPRDQIKPSTVLIWVSQLPSGGALVFPIYRTTYKGETEWVPPPVGFVFGANTRLQVDDAGRLAIEGLIPRALEKGRWTRAELDQLAKDYSE
jgi:hypothetical protein